MEFIQTVQKALRRQSKCRKLLFNYDSGRYNRSAKIPKGCDAMKIVDAGVLGSSFMDFSIPSEFAKRALYYCPQFGHFYCNSEYDIARESLDLFLLMYVCHGDLTIETLGRTYTASRGEIVLLDCHKRHRYYCRDSADFMWFHFDGSSSYDYVEYLYEQGGVVFSGLQIPELERYFTGILTAERAFVVNEHRISLLVSQILCQLADAHKDSGMMNTLLRPAIDYIRENYGEPIDLDLLADLCSISKPHLIRCFKKYMNCTPHEYLLSFRLRESKQQLIGSAASVEQIADQCGFNSASHFTRAFRKSTGFTPSEFRKMQF